MIAAASRPPVLGAAAAWVDLLDGLDGARVLLVDHSGGRAGARLADAASLVGVVNGDGAGAGGRGSLLGGRRAQVRFDTEDNLTDDGRRWDVIVLDGTVVSSGEQRHADARLRRLVRALAPGGRLVVVVDNPVSPLRAWDRVRRRPVGPTGAASLGRLDRMLVVAGLTVEQRFGLLPSSVASSTCFDLAAPRAAAAVLGAASVRVERARAPALRLLRQLAERRAAAALVPAWMVVASPARRHRHPELPPPTARLGYADSREAKILRGEPPRELEKRYGSEAAAAAETMALEVLEKAEVALAPRLLRRPAPDRTCQTWLPGRALCPARLAPGEVTTWAARSARVLGRLHRVTARPDGQVLVHGDYWLGNLLVERDSVVGVVDWAGAHWGAPAEDLRFLVDSLVRAGTVSPSSAPELARIVRTEHAAGVGELKPAVGGPSR